MYIINLICHISNKLGLSNADSKMPYENKQEKQAGAELCQA